MGSRKPPPSPFSDLVCTAMSRRGVGLRELCRIIGKDPSFFSKVLAGKRSPPAGDAVLRSIAAVLGLDPVRLILSAGRLPDEMQTLWQKDDLSDLASSAPFPKSEARIGKAEAGFWPRPKMADELL
ncbi:MAG: hypothetical protein ACYCPQ_06245 [Elusimicrobiota bacterium]